jgi:glycosyltransferase EpsF
MRVLHLLTALGPGGAEMWLLNILREMDRRECAMDFCLKWPEAGTEEHVAQARSLGAEVHVARLTPEHVRYVRTLSRILRHGRYDVVHSHEFVYSGIGVWVARRLGLPVVCTFHHWLVRPEAPFLRKPVVRELRAAYGAISLRYAQGHATYVTTLSRRVMSKVKPDYRTAPNCRLLTLSAAALEPMPEDARADVRRELGIRPDAPVVLHVGRFIEQKNHRGVLNVFQRVRASVPGAQLVLAGQGPLLDDVRQTVKRRGLERAVHFLGVRQDVPQLMAASDVFLFPSLDEGFGLAALEANAAGIPVVGSAIPGLDEAVVDGQTAVLCKVDDVNGMAEAVDGFLRDPVLRARFGAAGRRRVEREFSHAASARGLRALYDDCLRPGRRARTR